MGKFLSTILVLLIAAGVFLWFKNHKKQEIPEPVSLANTIDVNQWQEYTAPNSQFKVLMPGLPHHATENMADAKTNEKRHYQVFVSSKDDGTIYSISMISFPEKEISAINEEFLQTFVNEMLTANPKNNLKDFKLTPWKKGKAIDFNVENAGAVVYGKAFNAGKTLYVLSVTSKPDTLNPQEFNFFVNSFQLMNPEAQK